MNRIAKQMPKPEEHAPISILNRHAEGIRTMLICSCEWHPKSPSLRGSTSHLAHQAHRRQQGMPKLPHYGGAVFGEGPWMGLTWDEWWAEYGSKDRSLDPYTGEHLNY